MKRKMLFVAVVLWSIQVGSSQSSTSQTPSSPLQPFQNYITKIIQAGTEQNDSFTDVQHDSEDNIYVSGVFGLERGFTEANAVVRKYSPDGNQIWERQFDSNLADAATNIVLAKNNALYVVGYTYGSFETTESIGKIDIFISRINPRNGRIIWLKQLGSSGDDYPRGFTVDDNGNLYLVGMSDGSIASYTDSSDFDAFILKLNPSGEQLWADQFGTDGFDVAVSVEVVNGNLYVLSRLSDSPYETQAKAELASYSFIGNRDAEYDLGSIDLHSDLYYSIAQDLLYIAVKNHRCSHRNCRTNKSLISLFTMKQGKQPELRDTLTLSGWENRLTFHSVNMVEDDEANLYLGGGILERLEGTYQNAENQDMFLRKYSPDLEELWSQGFGTDRGDGLEGISLSTDGTMAIVGTSSGSNNGVSLGMGDAYIILADVGSIDSQ